MTDDKRTLLLVVLEYLFDDKESQIVIEHNDFKIEFVRPNCQVLQRYELLWNEHGDFEVYFIMRGGRKRLTIRTKNWFKVGAYLRSNVASVKKYLNINRP